MLLKITEKCSAGCIHCLSDCKPDGAHMSMDTLKNAMDFIINNDLCRSIGVTGGEPTETGDAFIRILRRCTEEHPEAHIAILSNGKNFAYTEYTKKLCGLTTRNITFCISFHSEIDTLFDKISGRKGSFIQTQEGIYNLARIGFAIEIRHVISKLNYKNLKSFAKHIYNYFPFCCHYAFMGMELHGLAEKNQDIVNIFPLEYKVFPVDERVKYYEFFSDENYNDFIKISKNILDKYKETCNPKNKKLLKITEKCDKFFNNSYTHGGYECGDDKKWTTKCVASYCDIGYIFDHEKKMCVADICSNFEKKKKTKAYIYVLISLACLILLLLIVIAIIYIKRCKNKNDFDYGEISNDMNLGAIEKS